MSPRRISARGAAAVEMALTMLLIVPVMMYALFLSDLLSYRLDQQEAVTSTLWDFTTQDYEKALPRVSGGTTGEDDSSSAPSQLVVQRHARLMFCDHESGLSGYDNTDGSSYGDCSGEDHHQAVTAHQCWLNANAQQITCADPDSSVGLASDPTHRAIGSALHPNGGLVSCSGRVVVLNYLLPKTFLQEFSKVHLTKEKWEGGVHGNAKAADSATGYYFEEDRLALLTDPWALNSIQQINVEGGGGSGSSQLLKTGIQAGYQTNFMYPVAAVSSIDFTLSLFNSRLAGPTAMLNTMKTVIQPSAAVSKSFAPTSPVTQEGGSRKYFSSAWRDWSKDPVEKTHEARGSNYMGCKQPEEC